MKARVTTVNIGSLSLNGLAWTGQDGTTQYGVAVSQVAEEFQLPKNHATRDIKALLGMDSKLPKISSDISRPPVSVVTVEEFNKVLFELAMKGNELAIEYSRTLAGLSITQLFADAFGDEFGNKERDAYIQARLSSKQTRRTFTDRLKEYGVEASIDYAKATLDVYRLAGVPYTKTSNFRDKLPEANLKAVERIEETLARLMANGKTYSEAVYFYKVHLA